MKKRTYKINISDDGDESTHTFTSEHIGDSAELLRHGCALSNIHLELLEDGNGLDWKQIVLDSTEVERNSSGEVELASLDDDEGFYVELLAQKEI